MAKSRPSSRLGWRSSRRTSEKPVTRFGHRGVDEVDNLQAEEDVDKMMIGLKINPDPSDEMQDMLDDQLTKYTKKELLADV